MTNSNSTGFSLLDKSLLVLLISSAYRPSLYLDDDHNIITISGKTNGYGVITISTCYEGNCPLSPGSIPDHSAIFFYVARA
jgi:hypothetical protein